MSVANDNNEQLLTGSQLLLYTERYNQEKKSLGAALLICLFFGGVGFHKFYLKQNLVGLLYLIFCWTLIPAMLSILDLAILPFTIKRYNNLIAVDILSNLQPHSSCQLISIHQKNDNRILFITFKIISLAIAISLASIIYISIIRTNLTNITADNIIDKLDSMTLITRKPQPRYALTYDGMILNMPLNEAKQLGYSECDSNKFYIICSNNKTSYPDFYNIPIKYAIAQFDLKQQLIILHLYPEILPNYAELGKKMPLAAHGGRKNIDYMELTGSNEEIIINRQESSIDIYDHQIITDYEKQINKNKLLD